MGIAAWETRTGPRTTSLLPDLRDFRLDSVVKDLSSDQSVFIRFIDGLPYPREKGWRTLGRVSSKLALGLRPLTGDLSLEFVLGEEPMLGSLGRLSIEPALVFDRDGEAGRLNLTLLSVTSSSLCPGIGYGVGGLGGWYGEKLGCTNTVRVISPTQAAKISTACFRPSPDSSMSFT